eukprot:1709932-Pyramimonas_sp.AAC.1
MLTGLHCSTATDNSAATSAHPASSPLRMSKSMALRSPPRPTAAQVGARGRAATTPRSSWNGGPSEMAAEC